MFTVNGLVTILSVEDLGICNNAQKNSYITVFVKEFGNDANIFRVMAYGSNAEYIARNLITDAGIAYVGDSGIAGYCQLHSKEERKANKVKIKARRVQIAGRLDVSYVERDVTGTKVVPSKAGGTKKMQFTIQAEIQSTRVVADNVQFIDAKASNAKETVTEIANEEIDYESLADGVADDNETVNDMIGNTENNTVIENTITADDANNDSLDAGAVINLEANGPDLGKNFKGR